MENRTEKDSSDSCTEISYCIHVKMYAYRSYVKYDLSTTYELEIIKAP